MTPFRIVCDFGPAACLCYAPAMRVGGSGAHDAVTGRLLGLDVLRGVAAVIVLLFHVGQVLRIEHLFPKGYLAVDMFFMLSGYVMARNYEDRLRATLTATRFLWNRYKRLWPAMAIGCGLGLPLLAAQTPDLRVYAIIAVANMALIPMPLLSTYSFPLNIAAWSIFFELFANSVHRLLLKGRRVEWLMLVSGLALGMGIFITRSADLGSNASTFVWGFPRVMFSYCAGILMWRHWRDRPPVATPAPAILLVALLMLPHDFPVDILIIGLALPLIVAGGLAMRAPRLVAEWMGNLSFPLYAVHRPVIDTAHILGLGPIVMVLAIILLTTVAYRPARRRRNFQPRDNHFDHGWLKLK